ncbi:long-chain-fatty-acid--CoA ligase [Heliophilum fasciatum]|uniref:Long-chain acyl-CoA synthetase n=1 Tax=Heliophilum fasciatum TaxID=35700 RepID=A0A4R2RZG9_9FIRM|nr:long-chain fatty acid--CoA ligase [Heliophilum fasciatum]MCW2276955.1 long-chain acyl-CoA synthetase [Heliophilum fasciatum]TCP68519.1 long-chain acyl-CoA synthetase [Heliophilum fasciatum]
MVIHDLAYRGATEAVALQCKEQRITYGQMQALLIRYRNYFYHRGIRPGDNVGLFYKNSPEFVLSYLAIVSLGAVVVPLNIQFTAREITYIVQDAEMKHVVTMRPLDLNELASYNELQVVTQLVLPELAGEMADPEIADAPAVAVEPSNPCVILYTSGTTGRPKGAVLSHANLLSNAQAVTHLGAVEAKDNVLCVLPMFHSFSWTCAVLTPLLNGATITIMEAFHPKEAMATLRSAGVTVAFCVPAMFGYFTSLGTPEDFAGMRVFVSGGASLPVEIYHQFQQKAGGTLIEGYGLSEASPVVTMNPIGKGKPGSIGTALQGVEVRIVDGQGNDLPPGEVGELITRGPNVMSGYYHLPEETAKALQGGWLHTGDMAYADAEGYYYIVDRIKDLIIVGGLNVYPREVEELLYQYPAIAEAAVIGIPDASRGEAVGAFVVLREGHHFKKKDLMEFLRANLAVYKLPREITIVPSLPKNATGKILKKELRAQVQG